MTALLRSLAASHYAGITHMLIDWATEMEEAGGKVETALLRILSNRQQTLKLTKVNDVHRKK